MRKKKYTLLNFRGEPNKTKVMSLLNLLPIKSHQYLICLLYDSKCRILAIALSLDKITQTFHYIYRLKAL